MDTNVFIGLIVLIFSAIAHEVMHGIAAEKLGDPTARLAGRITLNPIPHIDPIMTILLPALMLFASNGMFAFGAARPVPVNPLFLKEGRKDMALVALAGPATNLILALCAALILRNFGGNEGLFTLILQYVVIYNIVLGLLNLIPIPPLDGSKFFTIVLPEETAVKYQAFAPFGIFVLLTLLFFTPAGDWFNSLIVQTLRIFGVN